MAKQISENTSTYFYALGRRKTAVATVRLYKNNSGDQVNGKALDEAYPNSLDQINIFAPFVASGLNQGEFSFTAKTVGGGKAAQIEAIRLGLARAIVKMDSTLKKSLRMANLLTRDPRMVERKKPGLHKARKAEQYSKR